MTGFFDIINDNEWGMSYKTKCHKCKKEIREYSTCLSKLPGEYRHVTCAFCEDCFWEYGEIVKNAYESYTTNILLKKDKEDDSSFIVIKKEE